MLPLADVSGYTRYLGGVELDHAQDILADLLGAVVTNTSVMKTAKLEGAAHVVAGREELIGSDVILVHRLLKNQVADAIGTRGYALLTMPAIEELGLQQFAESLTPLQVSVDGAEIDVRVLDLAARWRELQRTIRVVDDPEVEVWADVAAPPAEIWRIMAAAAERPNWISVSTGVEQHNARGVPGVGTVNHCYHGSHQSTTDEIVDWAPFEHLTFTTTVGPLGRMWVTWALEPLDDRTTRIRHRFAVAEGFDPMSSHVAEAWRERSQADVDRLAQLVATRLSLRGR